jgi:hypothetical protein
MDQGSSPEVSTGAGEVITVADGMALKRDGTVVAWGENESGRASVPAGLSNVFEIAADGQFDVALITGRQPPSVYIQPHGRLEEMAAHEDLVFKGQVVTSQAISNTGYQSSGMEPHVTTMKVISVLKGDIAAGNTVSFAHYAHAPFRWGGPGPPFSHAFPKGECDCVFLMNASVQTVGWYHVPAPGETNWSEEEGVPAGMPKYLLTYATPTLDSRPLKESGVRAAHWDELNLLLNDTNITNVSYAIERLDRFSLAGQQRDTWERSDDFKRSDVLDVLLPFITNQTETVANRVIACFASRSDSPSRDRVYVAALVKVGNGAPSALSRLLAIGALSGRASGEVSTSLARLLRDPDANVRVAAVSLLTQFPDEFALSSLRQLANDESPNVRSVVADAIGVGLYTDLLPVLGGLFADTNPVPDRLKGTYPAGAHQLRQTSNGTGDVHASSGEALLKFDVAQVAGILQTNLNDATFHVSFVAKLAEKDAGPWLAELTNIVAKTKAYSGCWEDLRNYLLQQPKARIASGVFDQYISLLESAHQSGGFGSDGQAHLLYEFYRTKGLEERAANTRRQVPGDKWWFDDFDEHHPELKTVGN